MTPDDQDQALAKKKPVEDLLWPLRPLGKMLFGLTRIPDKLRSRSRGDTADKTLRDEGLVDLSALNLGWTIADELRRQDQLSTTLLTVLLAGVGASLTIASTEARASWKYLFVSLAASLAIGALGSLLSLALVPLARQRDHYGAQVALDLKISFNSWSLAAAWFSLTGALFAVGVVEFVRHCL